VKREIWIFAIFVHVHIKKSDTSNIGLIIDDPLSPLEITHGELFITLVCDTNIATRQLDLHIIWWKMFINYQFFKLMFSQINGCAYWWTSMMMQSHNFEVFISFQYSLWKEPFEFWCMFTKDSLSFPFNYNLILCSFCFLSLLFMSCIMKLQYMTNINEYC